MNDFLTAIGGFVITIASVAFIISYGILLSIIHDIDKKVCRILDHITADKKETK